MGVGEPLASVAPRVGAARSPLCTLAHTNSREDAEAVGSTLATKRYRMMQTKNAEPPAVGTGFRPASDRRASGETLRACEIAAAAILVQSHCRRRRAQQIAAKERRRVYRRKQIIREIHTSELSYHSSLRVLDEHYMQQVMWKRANAVAALPTIEMVPPTAPGTPVAESPGAAGGIAIAASPKGTPIASSPMGTPSGSSVRGRSGRLGRRGSVDSNMAALTAKLAARATSTTSFESRLDFPTSEEVDMMFCGGALMCLIDLSRQLTIQLADVASGDKPACCGAVRKVGEIFVQLAPRFLIFSEYCKRTEEAMETVTKCQAKYPTFGHFMSHLQSVPASPAGEGGDGAGGTLDLLSYLIMPVQRVPRYVMLLTELLDTVPAEDSASRKMVAKALEMVRESAVQIDKAVGAEQRRIRLQQVMTSLRDAPTTFDTGVANRTLVREGRVQLIEQDEAPNSSQLNVSLASISSHFGLVTPKAANVGGTLTPNRSIGGTPSRLSLGGTPNRRRPKLRRKSVCIEPDRRCYGNHLALLFNDCLLITKPFQNEFGHEKLRWVDCVWLKGATVDPNCIEHDDPSECGFHIFNAAQNEGKTEPELDDGDKHIGEEDVAPDSRRHTVVVKDAASKTEWLSDLERTIESAPQPPAAINLSSPQANDADRLETIGTPIELPQLGMSPLPTTPIRALKNALQRGKRASSGRNLRRGLRRKSTTDASVDATAALAASSVADEFRVSQDGSLMGDALPESDADAAALRDAMLEQLHALISLDMRKFLLESSCKGTLSEWATVSDWAHDTGGGLEERRAERGVWLRLFATVQQELAPQFGLDPEAMTVPALDSPARPRTECSPVLENSNELPVLDFTASPSMREDGEADETAAGGALTLNLPPLASTPLSTRSRRPLARASGGACCTAAQTSPHPKGSMEGDNSTGEREHSTTTENKASPEVDSNKRAAVLTDLSVTAAVPSVANDRSVSDLAVLARDDANVDTSTGPSSPVRTPQCGPETPSTDQQQRSARRKRRRSSFACCAAAGSP